MTTIFVTQHNRNLLAHNSGGQKSNVKLSVGLGSVSLTIRGSERLQDALLAAGGLGHSWLVGDLLFPVSLHAVPSVCLSLRPNFSF